MPEVTIEQARGRVVASWKEAGDLRHQSIEKFDDLLGRFAQFARLHGTERLLDVGPGLVRAFVMAPGRQRTGEVAAPAVSTMQSRRAVVRAFFRTARGLALTLADPTQDLDLPRRTRSTPRPLAEDEVELVWMHAWAGGRTTRHASTIALMLAGAHSGEVGHIAAADVDVDRELVRLHGSFKYRERVVPLQARYVAALSARWDAIRERHPGVDPTTAVLATGARGSDAHKQARVCVTATEVLTEAGLSLDRSLRPSSITAAAGAEVFEQTRQIDRAAARLGLSSLDSAARAIGWDWGGGPADGAAEVDH